MNVLEETKFLMKKYKIKANKSLGQNFLIDDCVIQDIVDGAKIEKEDLVIEIGPGLGSMTALLVERAKKVICIELDRKMIQILNDRFIAYNNIELINEDVLKIVLNDKTFGQRTAASIVGGRGRLFDLVGKGLIRTEKKSNTQNGKWFCNAWDVIKYATIK